MKVEAILLANNAKIENGLLHVEGGGWETYSFPLFPGTLSGAVAGVFALDDSDLESTPSITIRLTDADGHVDGSQASMIVDTSRPPAPEGVQNRVPFAVPFMGVVRAPTVVTVEIRLEDDEVLATVEVAAKGMVPDAPP